MVDFATLTLDLEVLNHDYYLEFHVKEQIFLSDQFCMNYYNQVFTVCHNVWMQRRRR